MKMWLASGIIASLIATVAVAEGVGQWRSLDADDTSATFFDQQSLEKIGPTGGRATFAVAWKKPDDAVYPTFRIHNVSVVEEVWESDCKRGTISLARRIYYSEYGDQLEEVRASSPVARAPIPGSPGMEILNLLCGHSQLLGAMFEVGPAGLVKVVRETRVEPKSGHGGAG
ncbi:surface-adhesin E family protein [Phenylobacterium aquaticum]|uniref:surface-adhesin E family protein n=1 Tax=Phenylobacterium aquaticum TaxID=1763816 RepID=UPI0026F20F9C|nr:surface-adhesin E family protein [Phenylobacterium aquaticum]